MSLSREHTARADLQEGIVLHTQSYRETSLLVDVFTHHHGRLRLLGKGARRGRHPLSHSLRPFNQVGLAWTGRGDLPVLTVAEPMDEAISLQGVALYCGFYLNELLLYLLPLQDAHDDVYPLYLDTLQRLQSGQEQEQTLRHFELRFLEAIGYGLLLEQDSEDMPIDAGKVYRYRVDQGAVPVRPDDVNGIAGDTLLALASGCLHGTQQLQEARRLMRDVMAHHLNGRKLKSRELFRTFGVMHTS